MVTLKNVQISAIWTFFIAGTVLMANKWQRLLISKQGLIQPKMPKHYPYKVPFLSKPADDNLAKQWVVEYAVWSEQREKLVRKRVIIPGKTAEQSYFYSRHKKVLDYLKFPKDYDLYGWKHTGVSALYMVTKYMKLILQQCGHFTLSQTDEYLIILEL